MKSSSLSPYFSAKSSKTFMFSALHIIVAKRFDRATLARFLPVLSPYLAEKGPAARIPKYSYLYRQDISLPLTDIDRRRNVIDFNCS